MDNTPRRSVQAFFAGITEFSFQCKLGVADPPLVDYLSDLLCRFIKNDDIFAIRGPSGKRFDQVADMLCEVEERRGDAKRYLHRHIGDFTLFWTGLFPEVAKRLRSSSNKDALIDYSKQGKRAYYIASTIPATKEYAPTPVLQRLSHEYELCVYGLGEVRKLWDEQSKGDGPLMLFG